MERKSFLSRHFKKAAIGMMAPLLVLSASSCSEESAPPARTNHSERTEVYNQRFAQASARDRTLFLDRDEIHRRAAEADPSLDYQAALVSALQSYVQDKTGMTISKSVAEILRITVTMAGGQANPQPYTGTNPETGERLRGTMCFIGGNNPDLPSVANQHMVMGLYPGVHDHLIAKKMRRSLSPEISRRFVDYHELGHCMNEDFTTQRAAVRPNAPDYHEQMTLIRHQSEVRAEIFAALMLARDGINHVAEIRADQRLINLATNGYLNVRNNDWNNPEIFSPFTYALHEGLWAAQRSIDYIGLDNIRRMLPDELADLAKSISRQDTLQNMEAGCTVTELLKNRFVLNDADFSEIRPSEQRAYNRAFALRGHITEAFYRIYGRNSFSTDRSVFDQLRGEGVATSRPAPEPVSAQGLARELLRQAGGDRATPQSLADTVMTARDRWRSEMENGAPQVRENAMARLNVVALAQREASVRLRTGQAPRPAPASLQNEGNQEAGEYRRRFCYN